MTKPRSLIEQRLGSVHAERLSDLFGGTQIVVPEGLTTTRNTKRRFEEQVGSELFVLLVFHFAGARLYVPQAKPNAGTRNKGIDGKRIARMIRKGLTVSAVARKLRCSERTIYSKLALNRSRSTANEGK